MCAKPTYSTKKKRNFSSHPLKLRSLNGQNQTPWVTRPRAPMKTQEEGVVATTRGRRTAGRSDRPFLLPASDEGPSGTSGALGRPNSCGERTTDQP